MDTNILSSKSSVVICLEGLLGSAVLACIYTAIYRLFLSPVADVPGPRLAALTFWYEFYYDIVLSGQYQFKIKDLHRQYGPVVRINPCEVHVSDPEFYDKIYVNSSTRPTEKWSWTADMFMTENASFSTIDHNLHRKRRAMFSIHFSKMATDRLEAVIRLKVEKLLTRLHQAQQAQQVINLDHAYSALTMDVITAHCFDKSFDWLDAPTFFGQHHEALVRATASGLFNIHFHWLAAKLGKLPEQVVQSIVPDTAIIFEWQKVFTEQVQTMVDRENEIKKTVKKVPKDGNIKMERTVFESMIQADVPASEKSVERLAQEAQLLVSAGFVTTSHMLSTITFHLLSNPAMLTRLKAELIAAEVKLALSISRGTTETPGPSLVPLNSLEQLPYLNAVVREGLRTGYGIIHRLPRVSPTTAIYCHGHVLPPGTPISMSSLQMHTDESIFSDPHRFNPDRWLPLDTTGAQLNKYLVPFSKGSRQCVGMNLAFAELYMTIAGVFGSRGKEIILFETKFERDVDTLRDGFIPLTSTESKGVRVMVCG